MICKNRCLILNVFGTRSWSFYLRSWKIGWCRLMLRLGKGYLPNGGKKSSNRSDLIRVLYGFVTKQVSTTLSSKHLALVDDTTLPPGQENRTNLLWINLGICSKDGNCSPQVKGHEPEGGLGWQQWGKAAFPPLITLPGSSLLLISQVWGKPRCGMRDSASVGNFCRCSACCCLEALWHVLKLNCANEFGRYYHAKEKKKKKNTNKKPICIQLPDC